MMGDMNTWYRSDSELEPHPMATQNLPCMMDRCAYYHSEYQRECMTCIRDNTVRKDNYEPAR